ncbi:hypothetical protein D9M73_90900 [compost metagenome]
MDLGRNWVQQMRGHEAFCCCTRWQFGGLHRETTDIKRTGRQHVSVRRNDDAIVASHHVGGGILLGRQQVDRDWPPIGRR